MSARCVGPFLISVIALFSSACAGQCRPLEGKTLHEVDTAIAAVEQDALEEYFFGRPETSIKKLNKLIELYKATSCTGVVSELIRQGYQNEMVMTHGRLARQYEQIGDKVRAQQEVDRALNVRRELVPHTAWSAADLSDLIERSDANIRGQLGRPPDSRR